MTSPRPKLLFLVTVDWFFCSHFLARAIAAKDAGYEVVVLTSVSAHGRVIEAAGLRLIHTSMARKSLNPFATLVELIRVWRIYRRERPALVHHIALKPIVVGGLAARLGRVRHVVNAVVGGGYVFTSGRPAVRLLRPFLRAALSAVLNPPGSRVVFENGDDLAEFVRAGQVSKEDAVLIRGAGVDPARYRPGGRVNEVPVVVLVARLLWDKGIAEFVEAARRLRAEGVSGRFVIVGEPDPDNRACIDSATLARWRTDGAVELWGFRSDIPDVLAQASIACLPSYREGLPKSLLEAMAASLPCVTTNVPGCREAVRDGDNGLLVPARDAGALSDALKRLLLDPALCDAMGRRGRQRVESEFASAKVVAQTLSMYEAMLAP